METPGIHGMRWGTRLGTYLGHKGTRCVDDGFGDALQCAVEAAVTPGIA